MYAPIASWVFQQNENNRFLPILSRREVHDIVGEVWDETAQELTLEEARGETAYELQKRRNAYYKTQDGQWVVEVQPAKGRRPALIVAILRCVVTG